LRVFAENSQGDIVLDDTQKSKISKAERLTKNGGESDAHTQGSAFTMAEDEVNDQKLQVKEDFDDLHVKIMAVADQIKGLEVEFYQ
jgi:hypothetical protein